MAACLADDAPTEVTGALVRHYVELQNLPDADRDTFRALAKAAPAAFVKALHDAALFTGHIPNIDLLENALAGVRTDGAAWATAGEQIPRWLSYYSLDPERLMFSNRSRDPEEKVEAERTRRATDIAARVEALTPLERAVVDRRLLVNNDGDLADLHRRALRLLAGMPLAPFAPAFAEWALGEALNTSTNSPDHEFQSLIRFNSVDWHATRGALRIQSEVFRQSDTSRAGKWALVTILRAAGDYGAGQEAEALAAELTKDRERLGAWRLVESYCTTDPCDPFSMAPDNIAATANRYAEQDVTALQRGPYAASEDHFFSMALAGLARFEPVSAVAVLRRLAGDLMTREGAPQRNAVFSLLEHSAAIDEVAADALIGLALKCEAEEPPDSKAPDWVSGQYALFVALPHKSGGEQLRTFSRLRTNAVLVPMVHVLRPADDTSLKNALAQAIGTKDAASIRNILAFAHCSGTALSLQTIDILSGLMNSDDASVRMHVLGTAARTRDPRLINAIVAGGWTAERLDIRKDTWELWYGSAVLIEAMQAGQIGIPEATKRMARACVGLAAFRLGAPAAELAARRVDDAVRKVLAVSTLRMGPRVERAAVQIDDSMPSLLSLLDDDSQSFSGQEFVARVDETPEAFDARQRNGWDSFERCLAELHAVGADFVVEDLSFDGVSAIVDASPELASEWVALLGTANTRQLECLHLFALQLASATASTAPQASARLFNRLCGIEPMIRHVVGVGRMPSLSFAVWRHVSIPEIKRLCLRRLDRAKNDAELATEVLAAWSAGMTTQLREYVRQGLDSGEPARICRALMVEGFSDTHLGACPSNRQ